MIDTLTRLCPQYKHTECIFSLCLVSHKWALWRGDTNRASLLENLMKNHVKENQSSSAYVDLWERYIARLVASRNFNEAAMSAKGLRKFCDKKGLLFRKLENELVLVSLDLELHGCSSETILDILKLVLKAEEYKQDLTRIRASLCLTKALLKMDSPYEALTQLNDLMPDLLEKGSAEVHGEAYALQGKILLKLANETKVESEILRKSAVTALQKALTKKLALQQFGDSK